MREGPSEISAPTRATNVQSEAAEFDVAIFGGGPAGCAAALQLASHGRSAVIIERLERSPLPIGETLPPAIRRPLRELDLWSALLAQQPVASYQIRSTWGSAEPQTRDYCCDPHGPAWHIDRAAFDRLLIAAAQQHGVAMRRPRHVERLERMADSWSIGCSDSEPPLRARFVVDASGRRAVVAHRLGVSRRAYDRQVALVAFAPCDAVPHMDNATLIEATPDGWWYSAVLPDQRVVIVHLTDNDLLPSGTAARRVTFRSRLSSTRMTRGRDALRPLGADLRIVAANTSRLESATGDGWLAVGDAMTAHDPLCGAGILSALTSGISAADAIDRALHGDPSAITDHLHADGETFGRYLQRHAEYYALERRWPQAPYWERRLAASTSKEATHGNHHFG